MIDADGIRSRITAGISDAGWPGAQVEAMDTVGDGNHWRVLVTSEAFEDRNLIERHKLVMDTLSDVLGTTLHAIEIKTYTPGEVKA